MVHKIWRRMGWTRGKSGQARSKPDAATRAAISPVPDSTVVLTKSASILGDKPPAASDTLTPLRAFLQVLDKSSSFFGPLKTVMGDLVQCLDIYEDAISARRDYQALRAQLETLFRDLSNHFSGNIPPAMTASMGNLCMAIESELDRISDKPGKRRLGQHLVAERDLDKIVDCYRRIQHHLERLTINADLSTWRIVDEQATETRLRMLTPSMSACYNSAEAALLRRRECAPNTRIRVLGKLSEWRYEHNEGNIYWLNGMAGTGKTTIANSLCVMLDQRHELGASFFCTRLLPECRNVKLILPTIAYQLARFSRPFRWALSQALERDPDVHTRALSNQFEGMIVGPLREVAHTLPTDLIVVIDALDECDDNDRVGQMLEIFTRQASALPIKLFISSRPEPQIRLNIGKTKSQLILHELDHSLVKEDIKTYLRSELAAMSPSEAQLSALVERAGVLFIYAATVVRYIGADGFSLDPNKRLAAALGASTSPSSNKNKEIDILYSVVLDSAFDNPNLEVSDREQMKLVLDTVVCAREPLTIKALAGLLQLENEGCVDAALRPLWSVLHISEANRLVTTLHASFPDYMLDLGRSNERGCDMKVHHDKLAKLCFERISRNERQFNICELDSTYMLDKEVPNLRDRIEQAIPPDLVYACSYWAVHLELGNQSSELIQLLDDFLSIRLLLWMEVLNLMKRMNAGAILLEKARNWCISADCSQDLKDLAHDAWRFATTFSANPVSLSTPHIYVSMLASWPGSRPLADHYIRRTKGLVDVMGPGVTKRQLALLSALTGSSGVLSVALSPDGTHIVSGYDDGTVCVWNTQGGQMVLGPLAKHTASVNSVAFSPDGTRIVSGSDDMTICVWDAQSGGPVLGPLEGHTSWVNSIAFSPDSQHIVSGSSDNTICVWDAHMGELALGPLEGHTDWVMSVAYSPNGRYIVSGSKDETIRVWDTKSGQAILEPFEGHTGSVTSVAFSPNSTCIVSGSNDKTLRLWNAKSGEMILGPLEGHTHHVTSVAFSPSGKRIVSASYDKTIRMWDAQNGRLILGPLEGHAGSVMSVAFSPDDIRIVSGSSDKRVCVWDSKSERNSSRLVQGHPPRVHSTEGHTDSVYAVAISPDGTRIISGSADNAVFMWDAQSGKPVLGPLEHSSSVLSIAISPEGKHIASGSLDSMIYGWNAQDGQMAFGPLKGHTGSVTSIAFSPDGAHIVSSSFDQTVRVWDLQSGAFLKPLKGHTDGVTSVAFSPDGKRIVSASLDETTRVWDTQNGKMILGPLEGHTGSITSVAFSPDGTRIASGSKDRTIRIWDSRSGKMVLGPLAGHASQVNSVAVSPDGKYIASGSDDKTIHVWDGNSGQMILGPLGHTGLVHSVAFSPDGTRIISGSSDTTVRVWVVRDGRTAPESSPNSSGATLFLDPPAYKRNSTPGFSDHGFASWVLNEDGWVHDKQQLLLWVPPDLRPSLMVPRNTLLMSAQGSVQLNFDHARLGESWTGCYQPISPRPLGSLDSLPKHISTL